MPTPVIVHCNREKDGSIQCECDRPVSHIRLISAAMKYVLCTLVTVIMDRDCLKHSFTVKGGTFPQ